MFFKSTLRLSRLFLLSLLLALPAVAQKSIEDTPIADVVPPPVKAVKAAPKPTLKPTEKAKPTAPIKSTPATSLEDAPIADTVPTVMPKSAPPTIISPTAAPKAASAPADLPLPEDPTPLPTSPLVALPRHTGGESEFDAPGNQRGGWLDLGRTFQIDFIRQALWAGLLVAMMCSFLGVYVVLKRIVFVGVALAELSSAGIAGVLLINGILLARATQAHAVVLEMPTHGDEMEMVTRSLALQIPPIWGAMLLMLLGVAMFAVRWSPRRVPTESVIGIVYSVAGALAILCIAKSAQGETHMLKLLQGDVLTVAPQETLEMLGIFSVVALIHALFGKEFLLVSFDRDAASTMGYNAVRWDFLLYLTIGVVISFSIRATGVLMATTMLIIPGVSALLLAQRIRWVWPIALLFGVLPVIFGLHLSLLLDLPASAVIVALSFLLLLPVLLFSSSRRS